MPGVLRPVRLALFTLLLPGCVRRVIVESDPAGAMVRDEEQVLGPTPYERRVWWIPFAHQRVTVGMVGYRRVSVDLRRDLGLFRWQTVHEVVLVPEHGPSGTWLPEDAAQ